jgi:hypothetical protein
VPTYVKWLTFFNICSFIAYNPFEHLAWLAELKIIDTNQDIWWYWTNMMWASGLFTSVVLNLRLVHLFNQQSKTKSNREDDPNYE